VQWWDSELERAYAIYRARRVHEESAKRQQAPGFPVPAYLGARVERREEMPHVHLQSSMARQRGQEEEEKDDETDATLKYVIHDLAPELYIELMMGFHK
jgi:hypothetical protein